MYKCMRARDVSKMHSNSAVIRDLGRYPICVFADKRCIKYYKVRLIMIKMPDLKSYSTDMEENLLLFF